MVFGAKMPSAEGALIVKQSFWVSGLVSEMRSGYPARRVELCVESVLKGFCTGGDETCQEGVPPLTHQIRSWITSDVLNRFGRGVA